MVHQHMKHGKMIYRTNNKQQNPQLIKCPHDITSQGKTYKMTYVIKKRQWARLRNLLKL
jgi:hypothetical protein